MLVGGDARTVVLLLRNLTEVTIREFRFQGLGQFTRKRTIYKISIS